MKGQELYDLVNTLAGTQSHYGFSTGNTLPIAAMPFGLTHWAVQTSEGNWFFSSTHRKFQGFRATHQPSPWICDYGRLTILPLTGAGRLDADGRASSYSADFSPHEISVNLHRFDIKAKLTPTRSCARIEIQYPSKDRSQLFIEGQQGHSQVCVRADLNEIHFASSQTSGGTLDNFACYYVVRANAEFEVLKETEHSVLIRLMDVDSANVQVGSSFISFEQARLNIEQEFAPNVETAHEAWQKIFANYELQTSRLDTLKVFANCLYRANLFPRETHEFDANGQPHHYSFYNGQIVPGVAVTDNGFWDTYRTVYPWYNLVTPSRSALTMTGWNAAYQEGGWFPQWASPGYRGCMVGTHVDVIIADAVVKGIPFDAELALQGMLKHATQVGHESGSYGRLGILDHLKLGYVAEETCEGAVARSLDYAYDDFCISQVAAALGKSDVAAKYLQESQKYRNLYDPSVGFMRARHQDGSWADFNQFRWGGPYVEGGAWQSSWAVQHDPQGLIELNGGPEKFAEKLVLMLEQEPKFSTGEYGFEIHEMTEMAQAKFGQYAQSNQPVHHVLYLFVEAGRPDLAQKYLRRVMMEMYTPSVFPGDEDNGEMSAWFLWSSLGLFPLCPGKPEYTLGAPIFDYAKVRLESGAALEIESSGWTEATQTVVRREVGGVVRETEKVSHGELIGGQKIVSIYG